MLVRFASLAALILGAWTVLAQTESTPNTLTDAEKSAGWRLLFDGKTTDGWRLYKGKDAGKWSVRDGALVGGGDDLITKDQFGDFELAVDWKFEKGNNSGIIYRCDESKGASWQTGPEMQVMPDKPGSKPGRTSGGSLYDLFPAKENALKPADQWNTFKIVCIGKHIEQWVNGVKVVDVEIGSEEWNKALASSKWKSNLTFATLPKGHIALQDHGGVCLFRNIKIRELSK